MVNQKSYHSICNESENTLSTIPRHPETLVGNTSEVLLRCVTRAWSALTLVSCALILIWSGCSAPPKPVSGTDVSPIQLRTRAKPVQPEAKATETAPAPVQPAKEQPLPPGITPVGKSQPRDELLQMSSMDLPQRPAQQAELPKPVQAPASQQAAPPAPNRHNPNKRHKLSNRRNRQRAR